jgi:alpha-beta hydrolase superfamily lysophospholipase
MAQAKSLVRGGGGPLAAHPNRGTPRRIRRAAVRLAVVAAALATLSACAPITQRAAVPPAAFAGPRLEQNSFVSFDGTRLGLSSWTPESGEPWAVIVGLHGMNDYGQAFWMAGPWWAKQGIATYAYDQRGFGRSPQRGVWAGEKLTSEDLRTICTLLRARYPHATIAVVGESMGGAVAIEAFASDRPPDADRLVLLSPAVWGWSSQPLLNRLALWITAHTIRSTEIEPPDVIVEHITASDNLGELRRMGRDPEMVWATRPDAVYGLVGLMDRASRNVARLQVPTAYLYGAHDEIIPKKASFPAAARLRPPGRTAYYAKGWHILLRDFEAPVIWRDVESFIRDPAQTLPSGAPPIPRREKGSAAG